jgi:hypothetical protein
MMQRIITADAARESAAHSSARVAMKQAILSVSNPEGREIMAPISAIEGAGLVEAAPSDAVVKSRPMGTWDLAPWDNDHAADWFGDTFDETKLAERVERTLGLDVVEHHRAIRAAASLLMFLGRPYVWPIEDLDRHLELAASKLEEMAALPDADVEMPVEAIRAEAAFLRSRLDRREGRKPNEEALEAVWSSLR